MKADRSAIEFFPRRSRLDRRKDSFVNGVQAVRVQKFTLSRSLNGFLDNFSPENCQNGHLDSFIA